MSTDVGTELVVAVPYTGEALSLRELPTEVLAGVLDEARAFEQQRLRDFKHDVQGELIRRADAAVKSGEAGNWTQRVEGWKIEADTPDRTEWEVAETRRVLQALIADGAIGEHWLDRVIVPERYRVAKQELSNLIKLGGPVAEALKALERPVARPRSVRVTREGTPA